MSTDMILDQENGSFLHLVAPVVKAIGSDFMLDSPDRRKNATPFRRALVHDQSDGLTVNFSGDYPGGVAINGSVINLNGPGGLRIGMDERGAIGASVGVDQVTIHGTIINLDTLRADSLAAGDVRFTFEHPDELDQDGNPRVPGFPETVFLGALITQLRDQITSLTDRVARLEQQK
jgi:hypothetical protein